MWRIRSEPAAIPTPAHFVEVEPMLLCTMYSRSRPPYPGTKSKLILKLFSKKNFNKLISGENKKIGSMKYIEGLYEQGGLFAACFLGNNSIVEPSCGQGRVLAR